MARESSESLAKSPESSWTPVARVGLPTRAGHCLACSGSQLAEFVTVSQGSAGWLRRRPSFECLALVTHSAALSKMIRLQTCTAFDRRAKLRAPETGI